MAAVGVVTNGHRRAIAIIALAALVFGAAGLVLSRDLAFTAARGVLVGSLMSFNPLGALITMALAVLGLIGARLRMRSVVGLAGAGFALAAIVQLIQAGRTSNVLGGRPSTFSFFLCIAVGLLVVAKDAGWRASD
jgi:hypothetical protein